MAAFSIPFWFAGSSVAKTAFEEVFEASRLEIDAFSFSLEMTATGLVSNKTEGELVGLALFTLFCSQSTNL